MVKLPFLMKKFGFSRTAFRPIVRRAGVPWVPAVAFGREPWARVFISTG